MPEEGFIASQIFRSPVVLFSASEKYTVFPVRDGPPINRGEPREIAILFVAAEKHYVALKLKPESPLPHLTLCGSYMQRMKRNNGYLYTRIKLHNTKKLQIGVLGIILTIQYSYKLLSSFAGMLILC